VNQAPALGRTPETDHLLTNLQGALPNFVEGLVELIAARVVEQLQPANTAPAQLLLTKQELARSWSCSVSTIDRLRTEGLPTVLIGESPRFHAATATAWLQTRGGSR